MQTIPRLRLLGFTLLVVIVVPLTNTVSRGDWLAPGFIGFAVAAELYALLSWWLLRQYYGRTSIDLADLFLGIDLLFLFAAIYVTGGEHSWLFWLPLVRVADQIPTGYRRVAWFGTSVIVGNLIFLATVPILGHTVDWSVALVKTAVLAVGALYFCMIARATEELRRTNAHAVDLARDLIEQLNEKSQHLERETERAEQASLAKSQFLARVSRELRRPATTIIGFGQLLELAPLENRQQEYVNRIVRGGRDLAALIDEVMDLAEVQHAGAQLTIAPIDVEDVLEEVLTTLWPIAADRGVRLVRIGDEVSRPVLAEPRALRRVLLNLISHGLRSSGQNDQVTVWTESAADRLRLYTQDSGPGVLPEPVEDLLGSGFALENEIARLNEMGLGLAFARALTLGMNGQMGADAVPGRATTFWIDLPLAAARLPVAAGD